jgi:predicted esterase
MILNGLANRFEYSSIPSAALCIVLMLWVFIPPAEGQDSDVCKALPGNRLMDTVGLDFVAQGPESSQIIVCIPWKEKTSTSAAQLKCAEPCRESKPTCKGTLREVTPGNALDILVYNYQTKKKLDQKTIRDAGQCRRGQAQNDCDSAASGQGYIKKLCTLEPTLVCKGNCNSLSVIWLHGRGGDGTDFINFQNMDLNNFRLILPHAPWQPVTVSQDDQLRVWFDVLETGLQHDINPDGYKRSVEWVKKLIEKEAAKVGSENVLVGGYSQGGMIALGAGLRYEKRLRGIVAVAAYLPEDPSRLPKNQWGTHMFLGWGEPDSELVGGDMLIHYTLTQKTLKKLKDAGYTVYAAPWPGATHNVGLDWGEVGDWIRWVYSTPSSSR